MNFAAFTEQPLVLQIHILLALGAVLLTIAIFSLKKGSRYHRIMGWIWVLLMASVALSSFWIHTLRWIGPFSPIHLLSILVLVSLIQAVHAARTHDVIQHARVMKSMVIYGLVITGALTFLPSRIMHEIFLGG